MTGLARRTLLGGMTAALALPARGRPAPPPRAAAARLTPADQRIDPRPALPGSVEVAAVAGLAPYRPRRAVAGTIRIWGHGNRKLPWMRNLVDLWGQGFARHHPGAAIDYQMWGTSSGIPALFNGLGDIAILGEEILPDAARAFEHARGYPPTGIALMTGSYDVRNFDYAQMAFVHRDNPLARISLVELDAILGAEHRRGARNIRRWGELGLGGGWAARPITPYSWAIDDSFGFYLQQAVLAGSHHWNPALREYAHITYPDGSIYDHGQQILDALAADPAGIAISNIRYAGPLVRPLPLAITPAGPFVAAAKASLIDQSYPLARTLPAVIDLPPEHGLAPRIDEFLRFILSRDGQEAVNRDGRYLPLAPAAIAAGLRTLA